MRAVSIAALLLFTTSAHAEEQAISLRLTAGRQDRSVLQAENLSPLLRDAHWARDELLGEALGRWLGVHNGRWDMFDATLAGKGGPMIAGTVRKNAAEIQLRWRPDE